MLLVDLVVERHRQVVALVVGLHMAMVHQMDHRLVEELLVDLDDGVLAGPSHGWGDGDVSDRVLQAAKGPVTALVVDADIVRVGPTKCDGLGPPAAKGVLAKANGLVEELSKAWRLVFQNAGLPITLLIFCFIELADEVIISSCSMVVRRYFGWHGSVAGFLIASLGALVLPAHFLVERASRHLSERKILFVSSCATIYSSLLSLD